MAIFSNTPTTSQLTTSALCVIYECIKEGELSGEVKDLTTLKAYVNSGINYCDTLANNKKEELKPIWQIAYKLCENYSYKELKELSQQVQLSEFSR